MSDTPQHRSSVLLNSCAPEHRSPVGDREWRMTPRIMLGSAVCVAAALLTLTIHSSSAIGQTGTGGNASGGGGGAANVGDQITIKREGLRVMDPQKYRTSLSLSAIQSNTLVAPFDALVDAIPVRPGTKVQAQQELIQLDQTPQRLQLQRASALHKVAQLELGAAEGDKKAIAQAKLDAAKAELALAQYWVDRANPRSGFAGEVERVLVNVGQFVRAGDPLVILSDTSKMRVEIPIERSVDTSKPMTIKVETQQVTVPIDAVVPLAPKFDPLRDLFESVTSAILVIDNADGKFKVGQTVYAPLIPRAPIVEVPTVAVTNHLEGQRKVQVLRNQMVRDIPIQLMAPVGSSRSFVSGSFADGDELIVESSVSLSDGFVIKSVNPAAPAGGNNPNSKKNDKPAPTPDAGF